MDYFRLSGDNRLLFGGGDSFRKGEPQHILEKLKNQMWRVFPQLNDLSVTHAWGGFVDMTMNRAPDFGRIGTNVYYLQGFSGHGIAVAGIAGKLVAEAISGQCERFDLLAQIKHRDFSSSSHLRTALLQLGAWYYQIMDRL